MQAADKTVLGNGRECKQVVVTGDKRLYLTNEVAYSHNALQAMGAYVECIAVLPTGEMAAGVLERLLASKPLVDLVRSKGTSKEGWEGDVLYSRTGKSHVTEPAYAPCTHDVFGNPVSTLARDTADRGPDAAPAAGQFDLDTTGSVSNCPVVALDATDASESSTRWQRGL